MLGASSACAPPGMNTVTKSTVATTARTARSCRRMGYLPPELDLSVYYVASRPVGGRGSPPKDRGGADRLGNPRQGRTMSHGAGSGRPLRRDLPHHLPDDAAGRAGG